MFVSDISVEKWVGNKNEGYIIENPTWVQIESAIRDLDGTTKTLVTLGADDETYMAIGGGSDGKYVVSVTFDNLSFYNLVDLLNFAEVEYLVVGGQLGDYPAKMCVDLPTILLAAKTFTESGKLEPSVYWSESKSLVVL